MIDTFTPSARVLDVTRLLRRAGRLATGVDRVELAYLRALLAQETPLMGLARMRLGYALLDREGLQGLEARVSGRIDWGAPDRLSRVIRKMRPEQRRAESDLRRLAMVRCLPQRLGAMLRAHVPAGASYLNVGHSNLTDRVLSSMKHQAKARIAVMIHDTIPLDFPSVQRAETGPKFRAMLRRVQALADLVICNSEQTGQDVVRHMRADGPVPDCVVAHLGVEIPEPAPLDMPGAFRMDAPFFVALGTIEPRKNHALLLALWEEMAREADCPQLVICGRRGWENEAVFTWLDQNSLVGDRVFECPDLSDGQIATLLKQSCGLLFPSLAEGYGLPPIEAATLGVPVICNDLPIYREVLGDIPVYVGIEDRYLWKNKIKGLMHPNQADGQATAPMGFSPPTWRQHFNAVLRLT